MNGSVLESHALLLEATKTKLEAKQQTLNSDNNNNVGLNSVLDCFVKNNNNNEDVKEEKQVQNNNNKINNVLLMENNNKSEYQNNNVFSNVFNKNKTNNNSLFFSTNNMLLTTMKNTKTINETNIKEELKQTNNNLEIIDELKNLNENLLLNIIPKKKKKKPYKELTLEQKVELIKLAERCTNLSQASIAERYAIAKSNVCRILQRKNEYVRALECAGFAGSRKRKLRTAINFGEENDVLIRKNNSLLVEKIFVEDEEKLNKTKKEKWKNQKNNLKLDVCEEETELLNGEEEDDGTSSIRSHMSAFHQHKNRRVIICHCCNLAFRDKNELNKHLKNRNNSIDGQLAEDVLLPTIENHQTNNSSQQQYCQESEQQMNDLNNKINLSPTSENNLTAQTNKTSLSPLQFLQQQQQNFLFANLWSNILFNRQQQQQQNEQQVLENNLNENEASSETASDQTEKFLTQNSSSSSSSSSSSVIVQTTKIAKTSTISPTIINSSTSSYISTSPIDSENDFISNNSQQTNKTDEQVEQTQQCMQCALLKPKLQSVNERSNYLEAYNTTFQNELLRLNAKCLLAEQCIRRLELELRQWRERNDILRFRLLECREKALAVIGGSHISGDGSISTADLSNFLGEMLKITLI